MKYTIDVKINPTRRKPVILVYYNSRVSIEFPAKPDYTEENLNKILEENKEWIENQVKSNKVSTLEINDKTYDFVSGTSIYIKGEKYTLKVKKVTKAIEETCYIESKTVICRTKKISKESIRSSIKKLLYGQSASLINDKVVHWASKIGVTYDKAFFKEYKVSWAHVRDNDLYFDWRIYFLQEKLINYLVIHELLHFIHRNHGDEFLRKLNVLVPDYLECERKLKENRYIIYRF